MSTGYDEEWDDGAVPDRHTATKRRATAPTKPAARPLRHGAAVAACLAVGFGGGVATAQVWEIPGGGGGPGVLVAADVTETDATAERDGDGPTSRSAAERAGSAEQGPDDVDLATPEAVPAPDPQPTPTPTQTAPAPEPTPAPTPEAPVPEAGSGLVGAVTVEPDLGGTLAVVPGEHPAPGAGTVRSVRVEVEAGLPVDGEVFATAVLATLNDPRGWSGPDGVTFSRTAADDASIRVVLASPGTTDRMCAPLETAGKWSCGNSVSGTAVLNFERWVVGATDFGEDLVTYRHYLVNHEVGHVLGHGHESCPSPGTVAPVMVQQSMSTEGCLPNGWPVP